MCRPSHSSTSASYSSHVTSWMTNRCNGSMVTALSFTSDGACAVAILGTPRSADLQLRQAGLAVLQGGGDEVAEQGVGLGRLRLELGVELDGEEPGVVGQLDDLDQVAVGAGAGGAQAGLVERPAIGVVDLVAGAVPLVDPVAPVGGEGAAVGGQHAGPGPQPHRPA